MSSYSNEQDQLRRSKEFVYEQWRKLLCIFVIGDDISTNQFSPQDVTSEKIRTIFDNGYKLAMLQSKVALRKELFGCKDDGQLKIIERLINQIDDRLETQKCLVTYSMSPDKSMHQDAAKRNEEFSRYATEDVTVWIDKQM